MSYSTPVSTLGPRRIRVALRRYFLLILALIVVGALAGLALSLLLPTGWSATTSVLIKPLEGNPYNPTLQGTSLTNLETEAQIAGSEVISSSVVDSLDLGQTSRELSARTSVSIQSNTQVLRVTYSSPSRADSARVSDAIAKAFLDYRSNRRDQSVDERQTALEKRIELVDARITSLRNSPVPSGEQLRALGGQLLNLRVQAADLVASGGTPGEVIVRPSAQRAGLSLPPWLLEGAGAVLGLLLGLTFALFRERRADLVRSEEQLSGLDVLVIGHQHLKKARRRRRARATGDAAEDLAVVAQQTVDPPATLAITGVMTGAGRNPLPHDVARELVAGGSSVLVIDALSHGASDRPGLSDALLDDDLHLLDLAEEQDDGTLTVPVGTEPHHVPTLFSTPRFRGLLGEAVSQFDWVVLAGPGPETTSGRAMLRECDFWVSIVTVNESVTQDTVRMIRSTDDFKAGLLGLVVCTPTRR